MNNTLTQDEPEVRVRTSIHTIHTTLRANCGCGQSYETVSAGIEHARTTGHTLHITGEIRTKRQ